MMLCHYKPLLIQCGCTTLLIQVFIVDSVRGHDRWPSHMEESNFYLVRDYLQAAEAVSNVLPASPEADAMRRKKNLGLKFTVVEGMKRGTIHRAHQPKRTAYPTHAWIHL